MRVVQVATGSSSACVRPERAASGTACTLDYSCTHSSVSVEGERASSRVRADVAARMLEGRLRFSFVPLRRLFLLSSAHTSTRRRTAGSESSTLIAAPACAVGSLARSLAHFFARHCFTSLRNQLRGPPPTTLHARGQAQRGSEVSHERPPAEQALDGRVRTAAAAAVRGSSRHSLLQSR